MDKESAGLFVTQLEHMVVEEVQAVELKLGLISMAMRGEGAAGGADELDDAIHELEHAARHMTAVRRGLIMAHALDEIRGLPGVREDDRA